jgi:hypothetical protein
MKERSSGVAGVQELQKGRTTLFTGESNLNHERSKTDNDDEDNNKDHKRVLPIIDRTWITSLKS